MKKITFFMLLVLFATANLHAQKMLETSWTTGDMHLYCHSEQGDKLSFSVGFAHDAGGDLIVKRVSNGVFDVISDDDNSYGIKKLKIVNYTTTKWGTIKCLYGEDVKGNLKHLFIEDDGDNAKNDFCNLLEGDYKGSDGKTYIFADYTLTIDGVSDDYEPILCEMGYVNGFIFKGKKYCFKVSEKGFNLYTTKTDDGEHEFEPDRLWVKLTADQESFQGRWPYLQGNVVTEKYCGYYSKELLRLMRNEIYARHGYKFNSADLTAYFSKMSWYKPVSDNSKIKLSPVEQVNIAIIKNIENESWHPEVEK